MKLFSLMDKNIAITGASSGIGHHFASLLSKAGARVILGARRIEKIKNRVVDITEQGGKAVALTLDVRNADSCREFLDKGNEFFGSVDVLINNAGVEAGAKTYTMIEEDERCEG